MAFFNKKKDTSKKSDSKKSPFEKTVEDHELDDRNSYLFRESEEVPEEEIVYDYEALGIEDDEDEDFIEDEDDLLRRFGRKKKSRNLELKMNNDEKLLEQQDYAHWEQHPQGIDGSDNDYLADLEYFEKGGIK